MKFKIEDNKKKSKQESKIKIIIIREPNRKRLTHYCRVTQASQGSVS